MRPAHIVPLLVCLWAGAALGAEVEIGMIKTLKGNAYVIDGKQRDTASVGEKVHSNDTLETGEDGAMGLTFIDNTTLSLGPNSQITLTTFIFDPNQDNYAFVVNIVRGTFLFVSGIIGKVSPRSVAIETPVSSIGIRGTRFLVKIDQ